MTQHATTQVKQAAQTAQWENCSPPQTAESARRIAAAISAAAQPTFLPLRIYLSGPLGAGKTFWVREAMRAWGYEEEVLSPSYMVAITHHINNLTIHHLDCYRLQGAAIDAESLELLEDETALCLLEWPECARDLPQADMTIDFNLLNDDEKRTLGFTAATASGQHLLNALLTQ